MRLFMLLECCKVASQSDGDRERGKEDNKNCVRVRECVWHLCVTVVCVCECVCVCVWVLIMASRIKRQHASATLIRLFMAGLWGFFRVKLIVRLV